MFCDNFTTHMDIYILTFMHLLSEWIIIREKEDLSRVVIVKLKDLFEINKYWHCKIRIDPPSCTEMEKCFRNGIIRKINVYCAN